MKNDGVNIKGEYFFKILRSDGQVEERGPVPNLFVRMGMSYLAGFQSTAPNSVMNHMHVGTGATAPVFSDTTLGGQVGSRSTMQSRTVTGANSNILTEVATFAGFVSGVTSLVLQEIGVFNHATTGGDMRSRAVFASITLGDSDFLQVTYNTTIGSLA